MPVLPFVSVVVPTYNRQSGVERLLRMLRRQTYSPAAFEVIVADTGSTDGTADMVASFEAPYRLRRVALEKRHLFDAPIGRNAGAAVASGELLLFLDSDMLVGPEFIDEHVRCHRAVPNACVCGACVHLLPQPLDPRLVEGDFHHDDVVGQLAPYQAGMVECSGNLPACRYPWSYCYGGNFSVSRGRLADAGGWDEQFVDGMLAVDTNLAYRLHRCGTRMVFSRYGASYHELGAFSSEDQATRSRRVKAGLAYTLERFDDPELRTYIEFRDRYEDRLRLLSSCARVRTFPFFDEGDRDAWVEQVLPAPRPRLSVLVLTRGAGRLQPVLEALEHQTVSPSEYEVLAYDLAGPEGIGARRPPAAADLVVQARCRPYVLRYYPAGPPEPLARLLHTLGNSTSTEAPEAAIERAFALAVRLPQPRHTSMLESPHLPLLLSRISLFTSFLHNSSLASRARGHYLHLLDPEQAIGPTFVRDCLLEAGRLADQSLRLV